MTGWYRILILYILLGGLVYSNSLWNSFIHDDFHVVLDNPNIRSLWNIPSFFIDARLMSGEPSLAGHYRPLVVTSYALNYAAGELSPAGYRMVNLVLHVGSAFLIFLIMKAILIKSEQVSALIPPLVAGLIFLVHPFNSEAVNYITARSSLMVAFFYLLSFYCWVKYRERAAGVTTSQTHFHQGGGKKVEVIYIACLLSFILALLSKEVAITLPLVVWLYDFYFLRDNEVSGFRHLRFYLPYLPLLVLSMFPFLIRAFVFSSALIFPDFYRGFWTQSLISMVVIVRYIKMLFFPVGMTLLYDIPVYESFFSAPVLTAYLVLTFFVIVALYLWYGRSTDNWIISFFMVWFLITLLPNVIIPLNEVFQENRGYLSGVGFAVILGVIVKKGLVFTRA